MASFHIEKCIFLVEKQTCVTLFLSAAQKQHAYSRSSLTTCSVLFFFATAKVKQLLTLSVFLDKKGVYFACQPTISYAFTRGKTMLHSVFDKITFIMISRSGCIVFSVPVLPVGSKLKIGQTFSNSFFKKNILIQTSCSKSRKKVISMTLNLQPHIIP